MILFVDDESRHMNSYAQDLTEAGYEIVFQRNVDQALEYLTEHVTEIKLLILDIMMPPGKTFKDADTDEGRRTGVQFYERVREKMPELPVIILTNVADDELMDKFREDENCRYFQKKHYLPFEIVQEVKKSLL